MKCMTAHATCGLAIVLLLGSYAAPAPAQNGEMLELYRLTELTGSGDAQGSTKAYAINDTSQIVGWINSGELHHAAHWHNEVTTDLMNVVHFVLLHPLFDQDYAEAYDISNADQVVGTARTLVKCPDTTPICTHAFVLRPAVLTDLATPYPGDALANLWTFGSPCNTAYDSAATGVSNASHVVGWADREDGTIRAFLVLPRDGAFYYSNDPNSRVNELMIDLGTLGNSDPVSSASACNDSGVVTGYSYTTNSANLTAYHAYIIEPDTSVSPPLWFRADPNAPVDPNDPNIVLSSRNMLMKDLGTLGGTNSWGRDINNRNQVVGESDYDGPDGGHYTQAFLYDNGAMTALGTLRDNPQLGFSAASGINDDGIVVGWAENEDRQRRAFVYVNGEMKDLNNLLYLLDENGRALVPNIVLTEARDINEDGVIVGWGTLRGGTADATRGFLLTPVLVDPAVFADPNDPNAPITIPTPSTDGPLTPSSNTYDGAPIFGVPDHLRFSAGGGTTSDPNDTSEPTTPPTLCGFGAAAAVPLTALGIAGLRSGYRRRRG